MQCLTSLWKLIKNITQIKRKYIINNKLNHRIFIPRQEESNMQVYVY